MKLGIVLTILKKWGNNLYYILLVHGQLSVNKIQHIAMMISMEDSVNGCFSTGNVTFKSIPPVFLYYKWEWYFYNICIPSIAFFGVVFILVVFRTPYMHTVTNRYLCHLAYSDILFLCVYTVHKTIEFNLSSYNIRRDLSKICAKTSSSCSYVSYKGCYICLSIALY